MFINYTPHCCGLSVYKHAIFQHNMSQYAFLFSIWFRGGISLDGRTDFTVIDRGAPTAVSYRHTVLQPILRPFACESGKWL